MEFVKMECERALENVKDSYKKATEETMMELVRIKNPPGPLQEVCSKFCLMVHGQEANWPQFKEFARNFGNLKDSMYNFAPEEIKEEALGQLMAVWKQS